MKFPLAVPEIGEREIDAVVAVLRTPNLSLGPQLASFEKQFAETCGTRHAVAVSCGTAGLHLLVRSLAIGKGDEVITTPFSFVASTNCILYEGAKPVFVDIDPDTWNIDTAKIEPAVTDRTRAILPVDVFGVPADYEQIGDIAARRHLAVIEDSCEALGSTYRRLPAGSLGDAGVFGFYPNKQITTGEGGMVVTDSDELAASCRSLRNQGRDVDTGWLDHPRLGFNYRLSDVNCALGLAQLNRLEEIVKWRSRVSAFYREILAGEPRLSVQQAGDDVSVSWFVQVVRLSDEYDAADRDRILVSLRERGVGCSNYFVPIHLQKYMTEGFRYERGDFPICESVADRTIALPFHRGLTRDDVAEIVKTLCGLL